MPAAPSRTTPQKAKPKIFGQATTANSRGDPAKVGDLLVKIAGMENPPRQFVAGSDALAVVKPALEARLEELRGYENPSKSTDRSD